MPMSWAARWLSAVARKARPMRVRPRKTCSPRRTTTADDEGDEREPADDHLVADADGRVLDHTRIQAFAVGREALQQQVLDDDGDPERRQDRLHWPGIHGEVEQPALDDVAEDGHDDHDEDQRVERVDVERAHEDQRDVGGHDAEVAVGEVDQPHDPEDQSEPGGEQRIQPAEQEPLDDVVHPDHSSHPEVGGEDGFLADLAGRALEDQTPFEHAGHPVGELHRLPHVLLHEKNGGA